VINDFAAINSVIAITHDFDDQSCALSTIYPRFLDKSVVYRLQAGLKLGVTGALACGPVRICNHKQVYFSDHILCDMNTSNESQINRHSIS
jgi:hypothetical protein